MTNTIQMNAQKILLLTGMVFLIASTLWPHHGHILWEVVKKIDREPLLGAVPIVLLLASLGGVAGLITKTDLLPLLSGIIAFLWVVAYVITKAEVFFMIKPFVFLSLIGAILLTTGGIVGLVNKPRSDY